ncbi:MAG: hypothetical protein MJ124_07695 [Lachnospiraceae bacterium]|nr:hypothetical protein [Lachnospiraceae bacterium]
MSVTKEFIMLAAGLIVTVSLIFIGMNIYRTAATTAVKLAEREEKVLNEVAEYELNKYEDLSVNGNKVIRYLKQVGTEYDVEIVITVANPEEYTYRLSEISSWGELRKTDSSKYINPLKLFRITVNKDENAALCGIEIKQIIEEEDINGNS